MSHWLLERQEERHHAALSIAIVAKVRASVNGVPIS